MSTTSADVYLPLSTTQAFTSIYHVELRLRTFQHDMCSITVAGLKGNELGVHTLDPISVVMRDTQSNSITFNGYVHDVSESNQGGNPAHRLHTVTAVGPSFVMKQAHQRIFRSVTISDVGRQLAAEHGLAADIDDNLSPLLLSLAQTGESDWAFLARICRRYGAIMYCRGTVLTMRSHDGRIAQRRAAAQVFSHNPPSSNVASGILSIHTRLGETNPLPEGMHAVHRASGIDVSGQPFTVSDSGVAQDPSRARNNAGLFDRYLIGEPTPSADIAQGLVRGAGENVRLLHRAEATLVGTPAVTQAGCVYLSNTQGEYDGFWDVIEVVHRIDNAHVYKMDALLGTESLGESIISDLPTPVVPNGTLMAPARHNDDTLVLPTEPGTVLVDGQGKSVARWRASAVSIAPYSVSDVRAPRLLARAR